MVLIVTAILRCHFSPSAECSGALHLMDWIVLGLDYFKGNQLRAQALVEPEPAPLTR